MVFVILNLFVLALITLYFYTIKFSLPTEKNKSKNIKERKKFHIITTILLVLNIANVICFLTPAYGTFSFVFYIIAFTSPSVGISVIIGVIRMIIFYGSMVSLAISVFGKIYFLLKKDKKEEGND